MARPCRLSSLLSLSAASAAEDKYPERNPAAPAVTAQSIRGTFTVVPGQSIQAAVDRARPGDRIQVMPGLYSESVTVDFDDIELVGVVQNGERPTFDGKGTMNDAVLASGNNFVDLRLRDSRLQRQWRRREQGQERHVQESRLP